MSEIVISFIGKFNMQALGEFDLKNILVTNSKSISHKTSIRKKKLNILSKCSKQTPQPTIQHGKENKPIKKYPPPLKVLAKHQSNPKPQNQPSPMQTQLFEQRLNLQENAIQSLHMLSIDIDNQFAKESKMLTRWYHQSTDFVLKKQRSISSTPHKSNRVFKKKAVETEKQRTNLHPFSYWELSSEERLYNLNGGLIKNLKDSNFVKEIKLQKRRYRSNLFDLISSKAMASKWYQEQI